MIAIRIARLRVGYVSPYFANHAESFFVVPLLEFHDAAQIEIHCYNDFLRPDAVTERLKRAAHVWHDTFTLTAEQIADQIRSDGTISSSISPCTWPATWHVVGQKPAPVQVAWLAYPGGMGLDAIDYRITDPGSIRSAWTNPATMKNPSVFQKPGLLRSDDRGPTSRLAAPGPIRFGSVNNPCKLNDPLLQLWSQVLNAVPDSQLLLQANTAAPCPRKILLPIPWNFRGSHQVCRPLRPAKNICGVYDRIDICLDPFRNRHHHVLQQALLDGCSGRDAHRPHRRRPAGASQLQNVGLPDFIAQTPDEFVAMTAALAADSAAAGESPAKPSGPNSNPPQ